MYVSSTAHSWLNGLMIMPFFVQLNLVLFSYKKTASFFFCLFGNFQVFASIFLSSSFIAFAIWSILLLFSYCCTKLQLTLLLFWFKFSWCLLASVSSRSKFFWLVLPVAAQYFFVLFFFYYLFFPNLIFFQYLLTIVFMVLCFFLVFLRYLLANAYYFS